MFIFIILELVYCLVAQVVGLDNLASASCIHVTAGAGVPIS